MNAVTEQTEAPAGTALTVQARAAVALGTFERERKLIKLAAVAKEITSVTNPASYQQLHATRMTLKRERIDIDKLGEKAREDAKDFQKAVIVEVKRLVAIIEPDESRLQAIQDAHDAKVEAEKEAKRVAEQERIARILALIDEMRNFAIVAPGQASPEIGRAMEDLEGYRIDERFAEFAPDAEQVKVATMNRLNQMHASAVDREEAARAEAERLAAEHARIKAESEELARRQAEQDERERKAHAEAIERARKEKALVDEGIRRRLKEDKAARDKIEADQAAAKARIEAQEREAREARAKADKEALDARIAEEARLRGIREQEEKRLRAEADRLAKERQAKEKRDKEAADKLEAKAKAKREKEEAAERARLLKEQERMDARQMLEAFVTRFGHLEEFAGVVKAIDSCLEQQRKAA